MAREKRKTYKQRVKEAKQKAKESCVCKHLIIKCTLCGKVHGSEIEAAERKLISPLTDDYEE